MGKDKDNQPDPMVFCQNSPNRKFKLQMHHSGHKLNVAINSYSITDY
jgi:hypothetical protein